MVRRSIGARLVFGAIVLGLVVGMAAPVIAKDSGSSWWPWSGSSSTKRSSGKQSNVFVRTANGATKMVTGAASGTTKAVTGAAKSVGNAMPKWGGEEKKKSSSRSTRTKYASSSKRAEERTAWWPWGKKEPEQETLSDWMSSPRPD